jgi:hypothetical protein
MDLIEIALKNAEAWNRHDVEAVVATYAAPATYSNPRVGDDLNPEATGKFLSAVWTAYPDAKVEIINIGSQLGTGQNGAKIRKVWDWGRAPKARRIL